MIAEGWLKEKNVIVFSHNTKIILAGLSVQYAIDRLTVTGIVNF